MENLKHTKDWQLTPMLNVCNSEGKMLFSSQANFSHEETKEYMTLAAAAPDLLEALILADEILSKMDIDLDIADKIENAINKATK